MSATTSPFEGQKLKYFWLWLLLGYLYLAYIIFGSLTPSPVEVHIDDFDKIMHFSAYAILMMWFAMIFYNARARVLHAVAFVALGVALEFAQQAGGVRYFEFSDMVANSLGVLAGYAVTRGCGKYHLLRIEQKLLNKASA
ncbi:MAG: VanZ family protein [Gammaproteobacteria bacterium]|nr:VanZ family protein [Gammaproteobacteria bacterium]